MADAGDRVVRDFDLEDDGRIRVSERHELHADGCTVISIDLRTFEPNQGATSVTLVSYMTRHEVLDRFGIGF